jgi:protein O-GlcNAc transferase
MNKDGASMTGLALAQAAERAGQWPEAYDAYRAIIAADARNAHALHRLGLAAYRLGRPDEALQWLQKALAPGADADLLLDYATLLQETGRWAPAHAAFAAALKQAPLSVDGLLGVATCRHQGGRTADALAAYRAASAVAPAVAIIYENLGRALLSLGRDRDGAAALRRRLTLAPGPPGLWNALGVALHAVKEHKAAAAAYRAALLLDPFFDSALGNLCLLMSETVGPAPVHLSFAALHPANVGTLNAVGNLFFAAGDLTRAARAYRAAARVAPDMIDPQINLAEISLRRDGRRDGQGARDDVRAELRRLIALAPADPRPHRLLTRLLGQEQRFEAALVAAKNAAAAAPGDGDVLADLGAAALRARLPLVAETAYDRLLRLAPDNLIGLAHLTELRMATCDWESVAALTPRLLTALRCGDGHAPPFILLGLPDAAPADQSEAARRWAARIGQEATRIARHAAPVAAAPVAATVPHSGDGRIRIGYLSADFREHAIAYLVAGMLESHDRDRFQVTAYSIGPDDESLMRRRIITGVERFVDLRELSDGAAATRIAADGTDILVDLTAYTAFARSRICAAKPAPTQVNWLGYPGTTGADFMDYIIADPRLIRPEEAAFYAEQPVLLPHSYQANDRKRPIADETPDRQEAGLPESGFVFCCFNNLYKITPEVFERWLSLLRRIPGSVLWLLQGRPEAARNLRARAAAGGVAPERLIFAPPLPLPQHLARHRLADLFLDTLPYNAHTTASDALWAGLPVLTCGGGTFAARVATSLLHAAGLPELAVDSPEAYQALALELAGDPRRLAELKQKLAAQRLTCPLFDDVRFARHMEAAFAAMHARRLSGAPPRSFAVADDSAIRFL